MRDKLMLGLGILMAISSLWGGSYVLSLMDYDNWARYPFFMTNFFIGILGFVITVGMIGKIEKINKNKGQL
jgi:drug/metabolite transporter (DMT)-like permease